MKDRYVEQDIYTADDAVKEIISFCNEFGFEYHETIPGVYIKTKNLAHWYIDLTKDTPKLYHGNYRRQRCTKSKMQSFHYQENASNYTIKDMLLYIQAHDYKALNRRKLTKEG